MTSERQVVDRARETGEASEKDLTLLMQLNQLEPAPEREPADKVAHPGDADVPAMARRATTSAGYVYLYRTEDGKRKPVNRNVAFVMLKDHKRPDGQPAWSATPPSAKPFLGQLKCWFHPEHADFAKYQAMGFKSCYKHTLPNTQAVRLHMMGKHKTAWAQIQGEETAARESKRDAVQERMAEALVGALGQRPAKAASPTQAQTFSEACKTCGEMIAAAGSAGLRQRMKAHAKTHA